MQPLHKRVLVVDDEPSIRDLVAETLRDAGFEVGVAANGVQALTVMHQWVPDAIVLDLMMPRLDGGGFTELMRLNPRYASIPVLMLTAAYQPERAARDIGAHAWLAKPFELDRLVVEVQRLIGESVPIQPLDPPEASSQGSFR